jgi:hypothetical protein
MESLLRAWFVTPRVVLRDAGSLKSRDGHQCAVKRMWRTFNGSPVTGPGG